LRTHWTNEKIARALAAHNPLPARELLGLERSDAARQLLERILHSDMPPVLQQGRAAGRLARWARRAQALPFGPRVLVAAVLALVLAAGVVLPIVVTSGGGLTGPRVSALQAKRPFEPSRAARTASGRWRLLDAVLTGRWQQNTDGPPPGLLSCANAHACYVMAGKYASPDANAPLLSESLYTTDDLGSTWTVVPMPAGFQPTSPLSCPTAGICAASGTIGGTPVFLMTTDGGSQWTTVPVNGVPGDLVELSCFSATVCDGIAGPSWASAEHPAGDLLSTPSATPGEAFVTTTDGGRTWSSSSLAPGDDVEDFACSSAASCLLMGREASTSAGSATESDFVRITADNGRSWTAGSLPKGFTLGPSSALSCADAQHCSVVGAVPVAVTNPPQCSTLRGTASNQAIPPLTLPPMSPAVAQISRVESRLWAKAAVAEAKAGLIGCVSGPGGPGGEPVSDIATTSDGGRTWTPDVLPENVPGPELANIACVNATMCWASGSEAVLQVRPHKGGPSALNGGSPVLLGTTDGGTKWSKVVFNVPSGAPNAYGQSYLSIGEIECPGATACIALGAAAQSSPVAPVYSVVLAPGSP
jgi:photosystem II stability/assembly factor-like uncharacterized protein